MTIRSKIYISTFFISLITIIFFALTPVFAFAATYYIAPSPTGSDANTGTNSAPWATFAKAFTVMAGGDTLYLMDGVYNQQITGMPSGTAGNYTKIYALNDHQVEVDGQGILPSSGWQALLYIANKSYIEIRGLRVHGSSATNHVCAIENSSDIILRVIGCWQAGTYQHDTPVNISGGSSNILLEDVWAFGRGRYSVLVFSSNNITLRRVVTRWDSGAYAGQPNAGVSIYNSSNNIIENSITLDHNAQNVQPDHSGFYLPANIAHSDANGFYANIALNLPNTVSGAQYGARGFSLDPASSQGAVNNAFINNVVLNALNGIVLGGVTTSGTSLISNTFGRNYAYGIYNGGSVTGTIAKNNAEYANTGVGINNMGGMTATFNGAFGNNGGGSQYNGISSSCTGCSTANPGLLFPTRIESTSPYKGAGESGADIGANIVYRYIDGILTTQSLWPWPYENWIKEDMCDTNFLNSIGRTGTSAPKWCTTNKTLTQYIWEYLGNPIPPEIYGTTSSPDTTPPSTPTGLAVN
ncbi:MAG: hypothetical protein HYW34_01560 [Candidatus Brennerbacteria bacterium]|nr:hypothetical protein [Candidatus Brennerbacteria bacterium]